jgi:hypothetical protein
MLNKEGAAYTKYTVSVEFYMHSGFKATGAWSCIYYYSTISPQSLHVDHDYTHKQKNLMVRTISQNHQVCTSSVWYLKSFSPHICQQNWIKIQIDELRFVWLVKNRSILPLSNDVPPQLESASNSSYNVKRECPHWTIIFFSHCGFNFRMWTIRICSNVFTEPTI